jgi:hypothetical protein
VTDRNAQSLLLELGDIERELAVGVHYDAERDLGQFVSVVLAHTRATLDIPSLNRKAEASESVDLGELHWAVDLLESAGVTQLRLSPPKASAPISGRDALKRTKEALALVDAAAASHHPMETAFRIEFALSMPFFRMQILLTSKPQILTELEKHVLAKLQLLEEGDIRRLWATLSSEFRSEDDDIGAPPLPVDTAVLGRDFFDPVTLDDIRVRIARYTARLKPILVRKTIRQGRSSYRLGVPTVPQILGVHEVESPTLLEQRILTCLLQIYRTWGIEHDAEFATALGLGSKHWAFKATRLDSTHFNHQKPPSREQQRQLLLIALRRLLNYSESRGPPASSIETALFHYKLGLEIMMPGSRTHVSSKRELHMQKELCRFLVERGVRAFGKSFGQTEVDLLAEIPGERFLIETKLVKKTSSRNIDRYITQLKSYMDQEEVATRGVLVLYNLSDTTIFTDGKWLRQSLKILPVNLCSASPSKIRKRLDIEDGGQERLVTFLQS